MCYKKAIWSVRNVFIVIQWSFVLSFSTFSIIFAGAPNSSISAATEATMKSTTKSSHFDSNTERWFLREICSEKVHLTIVKYVAHTKSETFGKSVGKLHRKTCEVVGNKSEIVENDLPELQYEIDSVFGAFRTKIIDGLSALKENILAYNTDQNKKRSNRIKIKQLKKWSTTNKTNTPIQIANKFRTINKFVLVESKRQKFATKTGINFEEELVKDGCIRDEILTAIDDVLFAMKSHLCIDCLLSNYKNHAKINLAKSENHRWINAENRRHKRDIRSRRNEIFTISFILLIVLGFLVAIMGVNTHNTLTMTPVGLGVTLIGIIALFLFNRCTQSRQVQSVAIGRLTTIGLSAAEIERRHILAERIIAEKCSPVQHGETLYAEQNECPVCLEEFKEQTNDDIVRAECNHVFHKACLLKWLIERETQTCPVCRHIFHQNNGNAATNITESTSNTNEHQRQNEAEDFDLENQTQTSTGINSAQMGPNLNSNNRENENELRSNGSSVFGFVRRLWPGRRNHASAASSSADPSEHVVGSFDEWLQIFQTEMQNGSNMHQALARADAHRLRRILQPYNRSQLSLRQQQQNRNRISGGEQHAEAAVANGQMNESESRGKLPAARLTGLPLSIIPHEFDLETVQEADEEIDD